MYVLLVSSVLALTDFCCRVAAAVKPVEHCWLLRVAANELLMGLAHGWE